jgi:hypothetical protein
LLERQAIKLNDQENSGNSGEFEKELTDDIDDFDNQQFASLVEWRRFYHKEYVYRGRLIGSFYDSQGNPTALLSKVRRNFMLPCQVNLEIYDSGHVQG